MESFPLILLLLTLLALITRPLTVLIHELGHAIPAILFTKKKVSIYIGSYGDPKKSLNFNIGLLNIWFKYNPLLWQLGLCIPSAKEISINKQITYILAGSLTSFTIALVACYFSFIYDLHGFFKLFFVIFLSSALFDLYINLMPKTTPIQMYDGSIVFNDGYYLLQLIKYKQLSNEYNNAIEQYHLNNFNGAATSFNNILNTGLKDENIYRLAISSYLQTKNYINAKTLCDEFMVLNKMNSNDYVNTGIAYAQLNHYEKALEYYEKALKLSPNNIYPLNNKGFILNILERFEEAIPLFDKAIDIDNSFALSYNNRGLAKIKVGQIESGLEDINHSFKLDNNNSYNYRNLGIYHLEKKEYSKALELFKKAKAIDNETHDIDELITTAKQLQ